MGAVAIAKVGDAVSLLSHSARSGCCGRGKSEEIPGVSSSQGTPVRVASMQGVHKGPHVLLHKHGPVHALLGTGHGDAIVDTQEEQADGHDFGNGGCHTAEVIRVLLHDGGHDKTVARV